MAVEPVQQVSATASTDPTNQAGQAELQEAFAQGVVKFMGVMLQSMEGDITDAINDDTSTPDSPS